MAQPPDDIIAELLGPSTRVTRRCEIHEQDGETLWYDDPEIVDGTVSVDQGRAERRTLDVVFNDPDGDLKSYPGGFWYDKIIKVFRGVETPTNSWETQVGEFRIDGIKRMNFPDTVSVQARDSTKLLLGSKLPAVTLFEKDTPIELVIRTIAINAGITKFLLPNTGKRLTVDKFFERGMDRHKVITDIATAFGYDLYFDAQGYMVMRDVQDPLSSPASWVFSTGASGSLAAYEKATNDSRIYNHVVVIGAATDTIPVWAEARNDNPESPTNITELGDRVYEYNSTFIDDVVIAQDVALKFLRIHALESFELNLEALVLPWLVEGDIVEFEDPDPAPGDPTRFLLSGFNIPLKLGTMSASAKRVTIVS